MKSARNGKERKLYRGVVTELCRYGAPEEIFFRYAFSQLQAMKFIKQKFNKAHGYVEWKYVEMEVEVVPPEKALAPAI